MHTAIRVKATTTVVSSLALASAVPGDNWDCIAWTEIVKDLIDFGVAPIAMMLMVVVGVIVAFAADEVC
jgi:hypothetical protein